MFETNRPMPDFRKIAKLTEDGKKKLKSYWSPLWGEEFATALTTDYKPDGKTQKVKS